MLQAIEGIYKDGKVELTEKPQGISEGRVIVTFLSVHSSPGNTQLMTFGVFSGANQSTEEDFKLAEFSGDIEDGLDWS
ncbi:MAG: hypothetical protein HC852_01075 [Acaryochloridaceae cyanobacterium RU_4_10]|nr:hypothetical protein [Acaryochloridaceae cyanobacterium RU_4_10]